jgi:hypothetical protein
MRIERIRKLRGPNRYLSKPVMVALVELEELSLDPPRELV